MELREPVVDSRQASLPFARSVRQPPERTRERSFRVAGLFAGIGGFERGLGAAGHETELVCEIEPGALAVLEERFPGVQRHGDVTKLKTLPRGVDLLVGGFPCQDLSQAGMTRGIGGKNSGLVGEVFRLIENHRVPWVLLENVPFMLQLDQGSALDVLVSFFEKQGYRWAYRVVDARAFGLPQRRQRVLFLATLEGDPRPILLGEDAGEPADLVADGSRACGFYWTEGIRGLGWAVDAVPTLKGGSTIGVPSPPGIWMPNGEIVTPHIRDAERLQGFPADWTLPATRVTKEGHRWKLVGNAVSVPMLRWMGERLATKSDGLPDLLGTRPLVRRGSWPTCAWNVGEYRMTADVSMWPRHAPRVPLAEFLEDAPKPLSPRAAAGFLERTGRGSLRFPPGFLAAIERHLARMRATAA
jgi:DNA (cytosine-5)-methyltransferase 1